MRIEMKNIVVDFGPVRAVDHVNFSVQTGQIMGLLGENGAGKSTLMNVLAGQLRPVQGETWVDGRAVRPRNARQATRLGIRFIHQELSLCPDLSVTDNLFLAEELTGTLGLTRKGEMQARARAVFQRMQVEIDPASRVEALSAAQKQLVEIARALLFEARLIIMDEPTTALSAHEIENLFGIMRALKRQDVGFIYISHKMPELFAICDSYTVLRDGKFIQSGAMDSIDEKTATELMTGRSASQGQEKISYARDEIALKAEGLFGQGFEGISFALRAGEILGITGLQSSGRDELADALYGAVPYGGRLYIKEKPAPGGISARLARGVAMVPRSRKERGILTHLSIKDNLSMGYLNTRFRSLFIRPKEESERYLRQKRALNIRADNPQNPITSLSGGNQQKVILGRWLETQADILLFDNPTQGIDVGAKFEIYQLVLELAQKGKAIVVFSAEYAELSNVCDRVLVMYKGQVAKELPRQRITEQDILYYATGAFMEGTEYA